MGDAIGHSGFSNGGNRIPAANNNRGATVRGFGYKFKPDVVGSVHDMSMFGDLQFDVAIASHVLEHLADPVGTLREVRRTMKPGARLGIEVPNELENLGTLLLGYLGRLDPYAVRSTHVHFFSPTTLRRVVEAASLTVTSVKTLRDVRDARRWRHLAKMTLATVEQPMHRGPLIELIAVR